MSNEAKEIAGREALAFVKNGMKLGIGTGSTAEAFIRALALEIARGLSIIGVPTSERTRLLCEELGVPLTTLEETPELDLTIDGADEIDPDLSLIKGGGGALLREKIVAAASSEMLVIADDSKLVDALGAYPLPIEVNIFGLAATKTMIRHVANSLDIDGEIRLRQFDDESPFITDGGHYILDASFSRIVDPKTLGAALNSIPGVVEHGLFTGLATRAIVTSEKGARIIHPQTNK